MRASSGEIEAISAGCRADEKGCLMGRAGFLRVGVYLALILGVRALLFRDLPLVLTGDSWDFLGAANAIGRDLDFSRPGVGLRDCRTPGYPTFLAIVSPLTESRSDRIVLVQVALGLSGVALGWAIGRVLRSPLAAEGLVVFLGLSPVFLLNEHTLMSEGLSLVTLLAFVLAALVALRDGPSVRKGLGMGVLLGVCILVRINSLPLCAMLIAGIALSALRRDRSASGLRAPLGFVLSLGLAAMVVIGPWIGRNYAMYHQISLNMHRNRTLLVYKAMHNSMRKLPQLRKMNSELGRTAVDYEWLAKLSERRGTIGAEAVAAALLSEQAVRRPWLHLKDIVSSVVCFGGIYQTPGNDRAPMLFWFDHLVGRAGAVHELHRQSEPLARSLGLTYVASGEDTAWMRGFRRIGLAYLVKLRPALFLAFLVAMLLRGSRKLRDRAGTWHTAAIRWLGAGYLATLAFHAATLTDSDRFTSLYDWVSVLVVLLVAEPWLRVPDEEAECLGPESPAPLDLGATTASMA